MVQVWVEPPEVWVYLSLPGTTRLGVSEGCDALLKSPDTPSKHCLYFLIQDMVLMVTKVMRLSQWEVRQTSFSNDIT